MQGESEPTSNRPADTAFKQQRLPAWQPLLTPRVVVASFFIIGAIFIPIGAIILDASAKVKEFGVRYDNVKDCEITDKGRFQGTACEVELDVTEDIEGPVFLYYQMENFFQNHRKYVSSRADAQLKGEKISDPASQLEKCDTGEYDKYTGKVPSDFRSSLWDHPLSKFLSSKPIHGSDVTAYHSPCGLIARSFFNDSIAIVDSSGESTGFDGDNIAWESDMKHKFVAPADEEAAPKCLPNSCRVAAQKVGTPADEVTGVAWKSDALEKCTLEECKNCKTELEASITKTESGSKYEYIFNCWFKDNFDELNAKEKPAPFKENFYSSEDFVVWMRTAALPKFKKLRGKRTGTLKKGKYTVKIENRFPVDSFSGKKSVVISNTQWIGGKSDFLGTIYCIVGGVCIFLAALFGALNMWRPRQLGDSKYLIWHLNQS